MNEPYFVEWLVTPYDPEVIDYPNHDYKNEVVHGDLLEAIALCDTKTEEAWNNGDHPCAVAKWGRVTTAEWEDEHHIDGGKWVGAWVAGEELLHESC